MSNSFKQIILDILLRYFPRIYKKRFFDSINNLTWKNIKDRNIENELLLIQYFLKKDSIFIDVGANLGQYVFMSEKTISPSNIYAFEPQENLSNRLKKLFPKANILQFAISNNSGNTSFKIPFFKTREIHTRGTLKTNHVELDETDYKIIDVQLETLDNIFRSKNLKNISLIKIDVEGAEFDSIEGSSNIIEKYNPVLIVEIEQRHHDTPIIDFIRNFEKSKNYKCYYFDTIEQQFRKDLTHSIISANQAINNHGKSRIFINNFIFIPNKGTNFIDIDELNEQIKK